MSLNAQPEPNLVAPEEASSLRRQSWHRLFSFLGLTLLGLLFVTALSRSLPPPPRAPFDRRALEQLKRLNPEFVLIGNSMVQTRFDENLLRRLLRPHRVAVLGVSATKSAVWYLMLKNLVVLSGTHPRVIQFFRDGELTDPRARALGPEHIKLERVSVDSEPLVEGKLAPPLREPIARLGWFRDRAMPFGRLHVQTAPLLDDVAVACSRLLWRNADRDVRKREINDLFALGNLRTAEVPADPVVGGGSADFKDLVDASFLPDTCQLAREHGIPLTFVRVRTRDAASGVPDDFERQYIADLARYVRGCGAEFYDMYDATWESLDMYGNGDHIAAKFKYRYTGLFVDHMAQIFH